MPMRDHAVPQGRVGFRQTGEDDQACIVDERIDAAEAIERELDDAPARGCLIEIFVAGGGDPPSATIAEATESATDGSKPLPSCATPASCTTTAPPRLAISLA